MKLAGIIFLIAIIVYFLIKLKKTENESGKSEINKTSTKKGDEKKKTDDNAGGTKYWKKNRKSLIIWVIILQFIVLNLIYPGEWFEVKKIFWFFAPKISGKYTAIKEHKNIVEKDKKKKLSDIQAEIRKFEQVKDLSIDDIKKLNNLKKQAGKINDVYLETKATKPAPDPVYKWVFEVKPEPEDIINARKNDVDQISYRENEVVNKPYFDKNEIRFKYKTSKGKMIYAILDKKSPSESHFLGMVDLPDQTGKPKGRKLIIRLKETSMPDSFDGNIETWDGENWYPQIPAFLKKVQIQ